MAGRINQSTPKEDGFFMPGEFEQQQRILMMWPEKPDIWRENAEPAQRTFAEVAKAILKFEPVTMFVSDEQYIRCRSMLPNEIQVVEMSSNDAWIRDTGPSFVKKGEVLCIDTDDKNHPFYQAAKSAQGVLMRAKDVTGKRLRVHKLCCPKREVRLDQNFELMQTNQAKERKRGDLCIASYANFLLVNGGVIAPQYKDDNDKIALKQLQEIFPERKVVGVDTREIAYGGGNIHCITQQIPEVYQKRAGGKE